ncbi:MAG: topoisomerase IV [Oscillospiraceae bacterium]|jgi:DNA gyrase subunit A|nr:topoisomerase IV [Oscillospiraceae bacterium]
MPKKNSPPQEAPKPAIVREQPIAETLEVNYMPYAMSVIVSRAIPEIDGFKPSQRKLLYTMYKMGLLTGGRTKSANIVGQTMRLNPHGDGAIYETMVRLSAGNEALLAPFVDSKGNFSKVYFRDTQYAASRYTEAKLSKICEELFSDIDKDAVDFADNYDGTMKEPNLLPTAFPNILVSANMGIAVGMATNICGFNLHEVCDAAIAYIKNPKIDLLSVLPAPDFPTGGELLYDRETLRRIYETGRGSFKVQAKWRYVREQNLIEIYEIPYSATVEQIIDRIRELYKDGKVKDVSDARDESDLKGLKIAVDLKRGADPDKIMRQLMKLTPLRDSFSCNFNILIAGSPKVLGVGEILEEWTAWRTETVRRRVFSGLTKKKDKLHLLKGLGKILLDIDKAIAIIRDTEREDEVVPNLMIGFGIDEVQAEYVAEIRLRNINREYILKRTRETGDLETEIADLADIVSSKERIKQIIIDELKAVSKKFGSPRRTEIIFNAEDDDYGTEENTAEDYPVTLFVSEHGYFKKITPLSLRMSGEQKYKEDDAELLRIETSNRADIIVFTDKCQAYKAKVSDFADGKASVLGDYLPAKLGFDDGESFKYLIATADYSESILFAFANGKAARVTLDSYATKTNRKKLVAAYSDKSPLRAIIGFKEDTELAAFDNVGKALVFSTAQLSPKSSRDTQGVQVMSLRAKTEVTAVLSLSESGIDNPAGYRASNIPAAGKKFSGQLRLGG